MKRAIIYVSLISAVLYSCKKDSPVECEVDPRAAVVGNYAMADSVFFLGAFTEIKEYEMTIYIDTLLGDTIVLDNIFGPDFGLELKANYNENTGEFVIPSQPDEDAFVSGNGLLNGGTVTFDASYSDGGYSFRGYGTKN